MKKTTRLYQSVSQLHKISRLTNSLRASRSVALGLLVASAVPLRAADVTWTNGSASFNWNLTDANWSTGLWNNGIGDGAVFGPTGVGPINVTAPISVNSIGFTASGYALNGTSPI